MSSHCSSTRRHPGRALSSATVSTSVGEEYHFARSVEAERWRVHWSLAHVLEFHRRENKPILWELFDRNVITDAELEQDSDCLANLERTDKPPDAVERSFQYEYQFHQQGPLMYVAKIQLGVQDVSLRRLIEEGDRVLASRPLRTPVTRGMLRNNSRTSPLPGTTGWFCRASVSVQWLFSPQSESDFIGPRGPCQAEWNIAILEQCRCSIFPAC
jgi:hypothetical protein